MSRAIASLVAVGLVAIHFLAGCASSKPAIEPAKQLELSTPIQESVTVIFEFEPGTLTEGDIWPNPGEPYLFVYKKTRPEERVVVRLQPNQTTYAVPLPQFQAGDEFKFEVFDDDCLSEEDLKQISAVLKPSMVLVAICSTGLNGRLSLAAASIGARVAEIVIEKNAASWEYICDGTYVVPDTGIPSKRFATDLTLWNKNSKQCKGTARVQRGAR